MGGGMLRKKRLFLNALLILVILAGWLNATQTVTTATEPSSCVKCHTDEKKLTANLSHEKPKTSAMTSGAG